MIFKEIGIVVAVDASGGIGKNNGIPWYISADLKRFKALTLNSTVIMGRKTWESMGSKPLKERQNIIVSSTLKHTNLPENVIVVDSVIAAMEVASKSNIFFIGGNAIYKEGLKHASVVYLTSVNGDFACDTFFPMREMEQDFVFHSAVKCPEVEKISYDFLEFVRKDEKRVP